MKKIENQIQAIQERNRNVELDKAWETSITRRGVIAAMTYIVATGWLFLIKNETPFLNALVPFGGYIFSTLSLSYIKKKWIQRCIKV